MITATQVASLRFTCDCHNTQTMAMAQGGKLTIMLRSHGERHFIAIPLDKLLALVKELEPKAS